MEQRPPAGYLRKSIHDERWIRAVQELDRREGKHGVADIFENVHHELAPFEAVGLGFARPVFGDHGPPVVVVRAGLAGRERGPE